MDYDICELEPLFLQGDDEKIFLIRRGEAEAHIGVGVYKGEGEVFIKPFPRPEIWVNGYFSNVGITDAMKSCMDIGSVPFFSIDGRPIEGFRTSCGGDIPKGKINIRWCPKTEPILGVGNDSTMMNRVVFHLFNFKNFDGTWQSVDKKRRKYVKHVSLSSEDVDIEIKSIAETDANAKKIEEEGCCLITHVGEIIKPDFSPFSGEAAEELIRELGSFLSFANGTRCYPCFPVGFDATNARVWEFWSSPFHPEKAPFSWFDPEHGRQLADLFPGFHTKWKDEGWRDALMEAIYWYTVANTASRGVEPGIILAQSAIERLSYEFCVKQKRLMSSESFKKIPASDDFRMLFSSLNLPLDLPASAIDLKKLSSSFGWVDAPHALTEIRNSLVHPEHKNRRRLVTAMFDAWKLSLWYLELSILAVCGYSGTYSNRLTLRTSGQVENVPWNP